MLMSIERNPTLFTEVSSWAICINDRFRAWVNVSLRAEIIASPRATPRGPALSNPGTSHPDIAVTDRFHAAADGLRLHLRDYEPAQARGAPAVCLAGLTRNADDFDALARALAGDAACPRRVVALDYRGRGQSDHDADWRHYDLATEWNDVLAALAICGIPAAHFIGTSRGGLHIMAAAAAHRPILRSVVLNDIGPVLEAEGLRRIKGYLGGPATVRTLDQAVAVLKISAGLHFTGLSEREWRLFAAATFGTDEAALGLRYDPALRHALDGLDLSRPLPDLWAQFDSLRGLPVLTLRGEHSDILSSQTLRAMAERWPGSEACTVPGQGHAPLLLDDASIARVARFLAATDARTAG